MNFKIQRMKNKVELLEEALFQARNAQHTHPKNTLKVVVPIVK
jgi:hypothetical protein